MEAEQNFIDNAFKAMIEEENKIFQRNEEIFKSLPLKIKEDIDFLMNGFNCYEEMKYVSKPKGDYQTEDLEVIKGIWVDQYCNGGYTGDTFEGDIYVKLEENKYLKIPYSC